MRDSAARGSGIARAAYMPATRARFKLQYSELYLYLLFHLWFTLVLSVGFFAYLSCLLLTR